MHSTQPTARTLSLALVFSAAFLPATAIVRPAHLDRSSLPSATSSALRPPASALSPGSSLNGGSVPGEGTRGLGATPPSGPRITPDLSVRSSTLTTSQGEMNLPTSVDLSQYNPPVGDQGGTEACVSWALGYYLRGWYARRDGSYPGGGPDGNGGFQPMYLYSQITQGHDSGSSFNQNLDMMVDQGIDTRADYVQGDDDDATQPTDGERQNAARYKIAGWATLFAGANQGAAAQQAIESSIAGGNPVVLGIPVYDNFWNASATNDYVDGAPGPYYGAHAVFISKYDANGVWVENSWGTWWGLNGWVELSWAFVDQYAWQAVTMRSSSNTTPSTDTSLPTDTPLPVAPISSGTASGTHSGLIPVVGGSDS